MTDGAVVTNGEIPADAPAEPSADVATDGSPGAEPHGPAAIAPPRRPWSMPKPRVNREQADKAGRAVVDAAANVARFVADVARAGARIVAQTARAVAAVPPAVQLFAVAGLLMLLGLAGAIALHNSLGLICTVVLVPVCAMILGALGHRWYSGLDTGQTGCTAPAATEPDVPELQRSVEYVDKKLATALTLFGTERHQQAVIALFQAKTAVEFTLGTEQDAVAPLDAALPQDDLRLRPRIRVGSAPKSLMSESNSLAAS